MLKEIIKALSLMNVSYQDMTMYFDRSKTAIYGWSQGKAPRNMTAAQLYLGIDQCRRLHLKLDKDTFVRQLLHFMDIPDADRADLWDAYVRARDAARPDDEEYYRQFIMDLLLARRKKPQRETGDLRSKALSRVAIGGHHILALKENGHVLSLGDNGSQQCNTHLWRDIVAVGAGWQYSAGLKRDGTCVVAGQNMIGNGDIFRWSDLAAIGCGTFHLIGLKKDGTAIAYGRAGDGQCAIGHWDSLQAVAAGNNHSVGLRTDGTVVCAGKNDCGQCETEKWQDVIAVAAAGDHTVGLTGSGRILAAGDISPFSFDGWTDIVAIATGLYHVAGLRSDGSVIATGHEASGQCRVWQWHDIIEIAAGAFATAAVSADGRVLCTHDPHGNSTQYLDTAAWKLFEPSDPAGVISRGNRYEALRTEFLALLLRAKEHALHYTVNAYPLMPEPGTEERRAEEANRHMAQLFAVSGQIWELHEHNKPLKPLAELMMDYSAAFFHLHNTLTVEAAEEKKTYQTGENTKELLDRFNTEIRSIERRLRQARNG